MNQPSESQQRDGVSADGAFGLVVEGYGAVYAAAAASPAFARLWAEHAYGGSFPAEFAHISFLTLGELNRAGKSCTVHIKRERARGPQSYGL